MKKERWTNGWTVYSGMMGAFDALYQAPCQKKAVTLPHDAMIGEERAADCESGTQSGFYPSKTYTYEKEFTACAEWEGKTVLVEFEGVMEQAMVYLNNQLVACNKNGYLGFFVNLTPVLKIGDKNTIKVIATSKEKSSRWYTGCGIYRNVSLYLGSEAYVEPEGIKITTETVHGEYAVLTIDTKIRSNGMRNQSVQLVHTICEEDGSKVNQVKNQVTLECSETTASHARVTVDGPRLWSPDSPYLYTVKTEVFCDGETVDCHEERFGIRTLCLDARKGLQINGKETKLRGACIHHDNGIIGAASTYESELFRMRQLKSAGFNSIRSAHNPAGKDLLRACDKLGILVMDELSDMWTEPKNSGDYAINFTGEWESDMERMVSKDYNHPSVVLYSTGNEIPEIGRVSGGRMNRKLAHCFHELDVTRYVTNAISGFLAASDRMAEMREQAQAQGQMAQERQQTEQTDDDKRGESGSEGLNSAMGDIQKQMMNQFAVSELLSDCIEEVSCELDVVGYNYLTARHVPEHAWHPERVVVGSETYPGDIPELWKIVEENPHVIGDFTWTGLDYIGEAGIGIFHYNPKRREQGWFPDRLAYTGDLDLNYSRRPVSYLREISYGLRKKPYIMVERPEHMGETYDKNYWKYSDAVSSWTYSGYEGKTMCVHVLSPTEEVELFLNGTSLGRKQTGARQAYMATYQVPYQAGELEAIGHAAGKTESYTLHTAKETSKLRVTIQEEKAEEKETRLSFLTVELADEDGNRNMWDKKAIQVEIDGEGELVGFGSAAPSGEENYTDSCCTTYDGKAMAVVRGRGEGGTFTVSFHAGEKIQASVEVRG